MASSTMEQHLALENHQTTFAIQVLCPVERQQNKTSSPQSLGKGIGLADHEEGVFLSTDRSPSFNNMTKLYIHTTDNYGGG